MTHNDDTTTTRRGVLSATAALVGLSLAGSTAVGATTPGEESTPQEAPTQESSNTAAYHESTQVAGTVTTINAQEASLVVLTEDGRRLCGSPDVYDVREGDRVTATVRDGRVIALTHRPE